MTKIKRWGEIDEILKIPDSAEKIALNQKVDWGRGRQVGNPLAVSATAPKIADSLTALERDMTQLIGNPLALAPAIDAAHVSSTYQGLLRDMTRVTGTGIPKLSLITTLSGSTYENPNWQQIGTHTLTGSPTHPHILLVLSGGSRGGESNCVRGQVDAVTKVGDLCQSTSARTTNEAIVPVTGGEVIDLDGKCPPGSNWAVGYLAIYYVYLGAP